MEYVSTLIRPIVHYMYYVMVYMYVCMDGMGVQCTVYSVCTVRGGVHST